MRDPDELPALSLAERDRRWAWTRRFLSERALDGLLLFGLKGRERYEGYLSNEWADGVVVFPLEGEPVHVTWTPTRALRRLGQLGPDDEIWVADMRVGLTGPTVVSILEEQGLARARWGVVGLHSRGPAEAEGIVPHGTWSRITEGLPDARFEDVSVAYTARMLVKSDEELALFRYAAGVGERACAAMLEATAAGVGEHHVYAAVMAVIHEHGCFSVAPHLNMSVGAHDLGWGHPMWTYRAGRPRTVRPGDLVQAEIFPCYGGIETQQQMAIAVRPVAPLHRELARVARRSYDAGLATMRAGIPFGEVLDAMRAPFEDSGCWQLTPLIHSLSPIGWLSSTNVGIERMPGIERYRGVGSRPAVGADLVLAPGMVFAFEPNACRADNRVNIGGTVVVTRTGAEELNALPTRLQEVG